MAEDNEGSNQGPRTPRAVQVDRANVGEAHVGRINVSRTDGYSGETKSAESDVLNEIRDILNEQTETLKSQLETLKEDVRRTTQKSQTRERDEQGRFKSFEDTLNQHKESFQKTTENLNETLKKQGIDMQQAQQQASGMMGQTASMLGLGGAAGAAAGGAAGGGGKGGGSGGIVAKARNMWGMIPGHIRGMVAAFAAGTSIMGEINQYLEMSKTGIADFSYGWNNFFPVFLNEADNLTNTFQTVRRALDNDLISPMGIFGEDIKEVAQNIRGTRLDLMDRGFDYRFRMSMDEMNDTMLAMYDSMRRGNMQADYSSSLVQERMLAQYETLEIVAANTGRTVKELQDLAKQNQKTLGELEASNILTEQEAQGFKLLTAQLQGRGMTQTTEALMEVARAGGSLPKMMADNPELARGLVASGGQDMMQQLVGLAQRGGQMGDRERMEQVERVLRQYGGTRMGAQGPAAAQAMNEQARAMRAEANLALEKLAEANESGLTHFYNSLVNFFTNIIPSFTIAIAGAVGGAIYGAVKIGQSLATRMTASTTATATNTQALYHNTMALRMASMSNMARGAGGPWGMSGAAGRASKTAAGAGAYAGMTGAGAASGGLFSKMFRGAGRGIKGAGRGLMGLGKGALRMVPGLGLGLGLLWGMDRLMTGDALGAVGELGAGAAGMIPGLGTAVSGAIGAGLSARDIAGVSDANAGTISPDKTSMVGPEYRAPDTGTVRRNPQMTEQNRQAIELFRQQNRFLREIRDANNEMVGIQTDINRNTRRGSRVNLFGDIIPWSGAE